MSVSRNEVAAYLATVPGAPEEWVSVFYAARMPLSAIERFVHTMGEQSGSPLRSIMDKTISKELMRINGVFGDVSGGGKGNGRVTIKVHACMSSNEALRLTEAVGGFCQPRIERNATFKKNGHVVMNGVRRCVTGYLFSKVPSRASIVEVGPDVKNWILKGRYGDGTARPAGRYHGARPVLDRRDVVRTQWQEMARLVRQNKGGVYSEQVVARASKLVDSYSEVFSASKIQHVGARGEYIVSADANYDIKFDDMPVAMVSCGAKAWHGSMLRVKGLNATTKKTGGTLPVLGVTYSVNWKSNLIQFRHPECTAFGYSHAASELVKYEERNGYVWETSRSHYIYSKCSESTDEILIFTVARVIKSLYMVQPNYVENEAAGRLRVRSVWAEGEFASGVPSKFAPVDYDIDRSAFQRVYEKRRALHTRGDFAQTLTLVRSTNVRMWFNGVAVGASRKIESSLAEATAVLVEVLASQDRLDTERVFSEAMRQFDVSMDKSGWFRNLLGSVIDFKELCGFFSRPVTQSWAAARQPLIDVAMSSLSGMSVRIGVVDSHVRLADMGIPVSLRTVGPEEPEGCDCEKRGMGLLPPGGDGSCDQCRSFDVFTDCQDSSSDSGGSETTDATSSTAFTEPDKQDVCDDAEKGEALERIRHSIEEFVDLEDYLMKAKITEIRIDAARLFKNGVKTTKEVKEYCTTRTQHTIVRYARGKQVSYMGVDPGEYSAMYSTINDKIYAVKCRGGDRSANAPDGFYYTSNHMRVWNTEEVLEAVEYSLRFGFDVDLSNASVVLGVPGAGKTYGLVKTLSEEFFGSGTQFLFLSVTGKAVDSARSYGLKNGLPEGVVNARMLTLDSYLINHKFRSEKVYIDEFPMAHIGRVFAALRLVQPDSIVFAGDGRQIPYDPFCSEYDMRFATLQGMIPDSRITFLEETHRLNREACAAVLDLYPRIYPCTCCGGEEKKTAKNTMVVERIRGLDNAKVETKGVRLHTYTRAEREDLISGRRLVPTGKGFKYMQDEGIATVHEDQGSTHRVVHTVRLKPEYDKKASSANPSLYNRTNYVLTDLTRHTQGYKYSTVSEENDLVVRRVALSRDVARLRLVDGKEGMGLSSVSDMLANRYSPVIATF